MTLVAGVDSSTQSCTVMLRDLADGRPVAIVSAPHPRTTPPISEQDPDSWWGALKEALGRLDARSISAISVDGQGHGLVALDSTHEVIRPAKLWNDTTSAPEAAELVGRLGPAEWARRVGSVPTAAFTITKLLWLERHEPANFARVAAVLLPHDWLLYRLTDRFCTDRTEASGTGYFLPADSTWQRDLLSLVGGEAWRPELPDVLGPDESAGVVTERAAQELGLPIGIPVGPGCNDNPASALALGIRDGDVVISLGTSGTVFARSRTPVADPTGTVDGNADPTGVFLPLVCTLNATKVTDAFGRLLGVDHEALAELALSTPADDERPVVVPYLDGERTPNRPRARGVLAGLRSDVTRAQFARAAYEGVIWGLLDGLDALDHLGVATDGRLIVTGGGARSPAYRQLLADLSGRPVHASEITETAAAGAAVQAAAVLQGRTAAEVASSWAPELPVVALPRAGQSSRDLRERFHRVAAIEVTDDLA
jgi:xylulokinase